MGRCGGDFGGTNGLKFAWQQAVRRMCDMTNGVQFPLIYLLASTETLKVALQLPRFMNPEWFLWSSGNLKSFLNKPLKWLVAHRFEKQSVYVRKKTNHRPRSGENTTCATHALGNKTQLSGGTPHLPELHPVSSFGTGGVEKRRCVNIYTNIFLPAVSVFTLSIHLRIIP